MDLDYKCDWIILDAVAKIGGSEDELAQAASSLGGVVGTRLDLIARIDCVLEKIGDRLFSGNSRLLQSLLILSERGVDISKVEIVLTDSGFSTLRLSESEDFIKKLSVEDLVRLHALRCFVLEECKSLCWGISW